MADDLETFAKNIRKIGQNIPKNASAAVRTLALKINQTLILSTPVKTGRARNNWFASISVPSEEVTDKKNYDPSGAARIQENQSEINLVQPEQSIYISNNLPYISKLNEGSSAQAPAGFVEAAVAVAENSMKKIDLLKEPTK